jgi:short-subunit dehydrogenase
MKITAAHFLITGANRGIGRAVAQAAAIKGAHVHLVMRQPDRVLEEILQKNGAASVRTWVADLGFRSGVERLLNDLKDQPIDILFNNAGLLTGGLIEEQPLDEIYSMFQVNLNSLVHLTQGLLPSMLARKRGKIINNSSVSAFMHFPCASTYAASKAAVVAFTDCLEAELKNTGVSTLCLVTPGIKTRMFDEIDKKYSKNFDIPTDHISPEEYASRIIAAIEADQTYLMPKGATALGLWIARYLPPIFRAAIQRRFYR